MGALAQRTRTGEILNQSYELGEVLESDGTCDTYLATDKKQRCSVRVKLLRPEFALQSNVVQAFLRTPKTLAEFKHPNVVQVLSVESDDTGIPFVVEEHVEGEPLARTIEQFPDGMPLGVAMNVLAPVVEAVAAAHKRGLVHGGLSREHVLLTRVNGTSVPKVLRFGAGCAAGAFVAPELRKGTAKPDLRSDVWALGALLYETLSGKPPGASEREHVKLEDVAPHLPTELLTLVERCLELEPRARPRAVSEVRDTLQMLRDSLRGDGKPAPAARPAAAKPAPAPAANPVAPKPVPASAPAAAKPAPTAPARPAGRKTAMGRELELPSLHDGPTMPDLATETSAPAANAPPPKRPPPKPVGEAEASFEGLLDEPAAPAPREAEASFDGLLDEPAAAEPELEPAKAPTNELDANFDAIFGESPGSVAKPKPKPRPQAQAKVEQDNSPESAKDDSFAFGATLFAKQSPAMTAADQDAEGPELTLEVEEDEVEISESEIETVEAAPAGRPSAELKTLSDLAAAFTPIEGNDRIGQKEIADPTLVSEPPEAPAPSKAKKKPGAQVPKAALTAAERAQQVAALAAAAKKEKEEPAAPATLTRKELKQKNEPAKALSEEQARVLRERTQEGERRRGRLVGGALFLLFAAFLLFALPMLYDPTRLRAQELFGERTKIVMGALAVLSVVSLVRTWAIQIQSSPVLLRPVTTTLKVVTVTVVALVSTYFLPEGALGPMERAARFALPWASGGFYLALGLYGLMATLRAASASVLHAALLAVLSSGSLFGSYQALASTVLEDARRQRAVKDKKATGEVIEQLSDYATGSTPRPGTSDSMGQRKEVGASDAEDLQAIEEMQQRRQKQAGDLDKLHKSMEKLVK